MSDAPLLRLQNLQVSFFLRQGVVRALNGLDLELHRGETLGVVGESGCGKSVTALAILGLIVAPGRVTGGSLQFSGQALEHFSERQWQAIRGNQIGMIFQDPMTSLNPVLTIGQQIAEPLYRHRKLSSAQARRRGLQLLEEVGLPEPKRQWEHFPHELSGGMRQRVLIAIALACEPELLIADEPTTALDVTIQAQILHLLRQLQQERGMALLFISHDLGVIAEMADRVAVMYAGDIVEEAGIHELFDDPRHPYTRGLLQARPTAGASSGERQPLYHIPGTVPSLLELPDGCRFQDRCAWVRETCRESLPPLSGEGHRVRCPHWAQLSRNR
ncbi:MAG: ABC transporter ATP-binding protein [bacterium]